MWASVKAKLGLGARAEPSAETTETARAPTASPDEAFTESWLGSRIREGKLDEVLDSLEIVLLQSDVAVPVVEKVRKNLKRDLEGKKVRLGTDVEGAIRASLEGSVRQILSKPGIDLVQTARAHEPKPYIVLFVGVNGTGKTTTVAKIALR